VVGGVGDVHAGVLGVPEDEHELDTGVPVLGHLLLLVCLFEVERGKVYIVAVGEEEDAPGMASALEDGAMLAAGEGAPVSDFPGVVGFGGRFLVGGGGHVFFEKGIVVVCARQRVSVDLVHLVVRVRGDDGHVVLLVELAVDEHIVAELWGCGQLSDDRQGGAGNVPGPWWQRGVLAGRAGGAGRQQQGRSACRARGRRVAERRASGRRGRRGRRAGVAGVRSTQKTGESCAPVAGSRCRKMQWAGSLQSAGCGAVRSSGAADQSG
jgi:hypothetical protein